MGTRQVGLSDVRQGPAPSRFRLLGPLRYLAIRNDEKARYDYAVPALLSLVAWGAYFAISPRIAIFSDEGVLRFARDLLIMAVPFLVGALSAVSMGSPGPHMERRPAGAELWLDGECLTLRQFVCYLLGYLSFLGMITLIGAVGAALMRPAVIEWTSNATALRDPIRFAGAFCLCTLLSFLSVTFFWSLYFLTDVVNRKASAT
jgi:hypothetical protein